MSGEKIACFGGRRSREKGRGSDWRKQPPTPPPTPTTPKPPQTPTPPPPPPRHKNPPQKPPTPGVFSASRQRKRRMRQGPLSRSSSLLKGKAPGKMKREDRVGKAPVKEGSQDEAKKQVESKGRKDGAEGISTTSG